MQDRPLGITIPEADDFARRAFVVQMLHDFSLFLLLFISFVSYCAFAGSQILA